MSFKLRILWFALCCMCFSLISYSQATLTGAEYFWDTDPGVGNAFALTSQDGSFNEAIETAFTNNTNLPTSAGLHSFNVRFKDFAGNWGPVYKRTIVTQPTPRNIKITAGEYFWDNDPGEGAGIALVAFDGAFDEALETVFKNPLSIPSQGGIHLFNVRLKDETGTWGPVFKRVIAVQDTPRTIKITAAEYFWGTNDPGFGSGTTIIAFDNAFDEAVETVMHNPLNLPPNSGLNLFNIRIKDENGIWGPTYKRVIALQNNPRNIKITAAEYFWGTTDPGLGSGTTLLAFDGTFDEAVETVFKNSITTNSLNGLQLFNIRVKDESGVWGPLFKRTIALQDVARNIKISAAEFFWGTSDPGLGSGTPLLAFDGAFDESIETVIKTAISIPSLQGLQLFNIRVKDENGVWGPLYKRTIAIQDVARDIKITSGEYFWGTTDPGEGSGTSMLAFDGAYNKAIETAFSSGVSSPGVGLQLFNVRLRDENGTWGPVYKRTIYMQIPGNSLPVNINSNIIGNSICQGSTIQLSASGGSSFTWSPSTGLSSSTGSTVTANPSSTTTYTVTGINGQGNAGSATITVTVNPTPNASIQGINVTCPSGSTLSASGGQTYVWSNGSSAQTINVNPLSTTTYTVTVTANGCSATKSRTIYPVDTITWTGSIDTDWHKPCNWNPPAVPQACNSVVIPFTTNQPIISQIASCKDLWIYTSNGANLVINTNANLQIETCPLSASENSCP
jgi:hypothetical protein